MQIFTWIVLGFFAGGIVAFVIKDTRKIIVFLDLLLGAIGAVIGGIITDALTLQKISGVYDETVLLVVMCAGILIWIGRTIFTKNLV